MIDMTAVSVDGYLSAVDRQIAGMPQATRAAVLDDLRAHIEDALADGRPLGQVLHGLGDPTAVATDYLAQAGLAPTAPRLLRWFDVIIVVLAVLSTIVGLVETARDSLPGTDPDTGLPLPETAFAAYNGLGGMVLSLIPLLLVVALLFLPARYRAKARLVLASVFTIGMVAVALPYGSDEMVAAQAPVRDIIGRLVPDPAVVFALWGAVFLGLWLRGSRPRALAVVLRLCAATVLVWSGGTGILSALVSSPADLGAVIFPALLTLAGILFACGLRLAYLLVIALASIAMIVGVVAPDPYAYLNWVFGSVALVFGLVAWFGSAPRMRPTVREAAGS